MLATPLFQIITLHFYGEVENILIQSSSGTSVTDFTEGARKICAIFPDIDKRGLATELDMIKKCCTDGTIGAFNNLYSMTDALLLKPPEVRMMFPEVIKVINLHAVVPATSATAERTFSCLRRLKTWLRSTMSQSRLNHLAVLHTYRDMEPQLTKVLSHFVGLNDGRHRIFGNF